MYIREKPYNSLKQSLGKSPTKIQKDSIEALFSFEDAKPTEMMVPVDFAEIKKKHGKGKDDEELLDVLLENLKPKDAAEAIIKARDLFVSNPGGEDEEDRADPMTVKEWQECQDEPSSEEDVSEDLDDDLDDSSILHLREKPFKKLETQAKGSGKITKEQVLELVELEDVPDDEIMFPVVLSSIAGCEDLDDLGEMVDKIGAKEFIQAVSKFRESPDDDDSEGLKPVTVKELREMIEVSDDEDLLEEPEDEEDDEDEDEDEDDEDDDEEEVAEPPAKKAKK